MSDICNQDGYLSTSCRHYAAGHINVDLDCIVPSDKYNYPPDSQQSEVLYPICHDFSCWGSCAKVSPWPRRTSSPIWHPSIGLQVGLW
jgi:hypothetical protein